MGKWLAFTFALTGRREWGHGTQGVALGWGLAGLSARAEAYVLMMLILRQRREDPMLEGA